MEIADIFAVNKADREGAQRLVREIEATLNLVPNRETRPKVCSTVATRAEGVAGLKAALHAHQRSLDQGGRLQERRHIRLSSYVRTLVEDRCLQDLWDSNDRQARFDALVEKVAAGEISPYEAARSVLA
jgi:LAO/AO transport system kinase